MFKLRYLVIPCAILGISFATYATEKPNNATKEATSIAATKKAIQPNEKVSINSATAAELQKVKFIGKKKSEAIVNYRTQNGQFKSIDELLQVKCRGINKHWLDKISSQITI